MQILKTITNGLKNATSWTAKKLAQLDEKTADFLLRQDARKREQEQEAYILKTLIAERREQILAKSTAERQAYLAYLKAEQEKTEKELDGCEVVKPDQTK